MHLERRAQDVRHTYTLRCPRSDWHALATCGVRAKVEQQPARASRPPAPHPARRDTPAVSRPTSSDASAPDAVFGALDWLSIQSTPDPGPSYDAPNGELPSHADDLPFEFGGGGGAAGGGSDGVFDLDDDA